jgi:predicted glycosyltransferase
MRVWIDLSNSPHPLLFAPVASRLEQLGHEVLVTARDNAQTVELAHERWDSVEVIGSPSPPGRRSKALPILSRIRRLASWARSERPDAALSHNSYAQIVAARALGIPAVTAMDYEHQPANHVAFRLAGTVLVPAALAEGDVSLRRMGLTRAKTRVYDGLKEELYLGDFTPDRRAPERLGVDRGPETVLVVARTPPSGALYHRSDNPLFVETLRSLCANRDVRCVVLTRRPGQRRELLELGLPNVVIPEQAVDARSLMFACDLVLGAGGTMTREGALLGVPTISLFAGRSSAVEQRLERMGRLRRLVTVVDLGPIRRRQADPVDPRQLRARGEVLIAEFISAVIEPRTAPPPVTGWADARA